MPGWGEILEEFKQSAAQRNGSPDADGIRRAYINRLAAATGRPVIAYSTAWLSKPGDISIVPQDMHGFMVACQDLPGPSLDLIIHSPGGVAEAAASIVHYLRQKYSDIRVFVPLAAMSAATMWTMAADRIVMGSHSQLGPIDPQFTIGDRNGGPPRPVAASAILNQFRQAKEEISKDPKALGAWSLILPMYGPGLLQQCETATELSKGLVHDWLQQYMFRNDPGRSEKARQIAEFLGTHETHQSHNVGIFREKLKDLGLVVDDLEDTCQDEVLSILHATLITFSLTQCVKMIENSLGRGYYNSQQPPTFSFPIPIPQVAPQPGQPGIPIQFPPGLPFPQRLVNPQPPQPPQP